MSFSPLETCFRPTWSKLLFNRWDAKTLQLWSKMYCITGSFFNMTTEICHIHNGHLSPRSWQYRSRSIPILKPKPTVSQDLSKSTARCIFIYGIQDDNGTDIQNFSLNLTPPPDVVFRTLPGTSDGMNVLGIVIFSATMGEFMRLPHTPWMGKPVHLRCYMQ